MTRGLPSLCRRTPALDYAPSRPVLAVGDLPEADLPGRHVDVAGEQVKVLERRLVVAGQPPLREDVAGRGARRSPARHSVTRRRCVPVASAEAVVQSTEGNTIANAWPPPRSRS